MSFDTLFAHHRHRPIGKSSAGQGNGQPRRPRLMLAYANRLALALNVVLDEHLFET
jgi:hypothetical protein